MDLNPGDTRVAALQVAQFLAGFPQFSHLPPLQIDPSSPSFLLFSVSSLVKKDRKYQMVKKDCKYTNIQRPKIARNKNKNMGGIDV